MTTETSIVKSIFLQASRETVWSYLTDKDKLGLWFYPGAADLADGQDYALMGKADDGSDKKMCWGTVSEMHKPSSLVYSFTFAPLAGEMTTVHWTLEEAAGGTRLSLRHEGISEAAGAAALAMLMALDAGWDKHLAALRAAIA